MVMTQNYPVYFDTAKIPLEHFFPSLDRKYLEKRFSKYESKQQRHTETIPEKINRAFKTYLMFAETPARQHKSIPDAFSLYSQGKSDIRQFLKLSLGFNREQLFQFFKEEELIDEILVASKALKQTKAYRLTDKTRDAYKKFKEIYVLDPKKRIIPDKREKAILPKTIANEPRKSSIQLPKWLELKRYNSSYVDFISLQQHEFHMLIQNQNEIFKEDDWSYLKMIRESAVAQSGFLGQVYQESIYGRIYGNNIKENLQLIPNRFLRFLIPDSYDYDMTASCYMLTAQLASHYDSKISTDSIDDYVKDRKRKRRIISEKMNLDKDIVKELFTIIGHGGRTFYHHDSFSIVDKIGSQQKAKEFLEDDYVKSIIEEMKECHRVILEHYQFPKNFMRTGPKKEQRIAFAVFQTEVNILECCVRYCQMFSKDVLALKHDGFLVSEKIDMKALKKYIHNETNWVINFEENQTESYPDTA